MRSWPLNALGSRAVALVACALCGACDFDLRDVALTDDAAPARNGDARGPQDSGKPPGGPPSDAAAPLVEPPSRPAEQTDGGHDPPAATQAGASGGSPMDAAATGMDAATAMDAAGMAMDAELPPLDAGPDAAGDGAAEDDDASDDGDAASEAGIVDPCTDGSLQCVPVSIVVFGNWGFQALPRATIVVTAGERIADLRLDSHTFRGEVADGFVTLDLPIERELWLHVTADGYLPTDMPQWIEREGKVEVQVFSAQFVTDYLSLLQLERDETTGLVLALIERPGLPAAPPVIGAGMDLDRSHDGPFTASRGIFVVSNVLLSDGNKGLVFPNVSPGTITPSWISPPGYACAGPFDRGYPVVANTALSIPIFCHELDLDADAGSPD